MIAYDIINHDFFFKLLKIISPIWL